MFVSFLIWSLEAEGFVIPTGSMAPTLMGRHKEIVCPQCGYMYTVNADREVEPTGRGASTGRRIESGTCENCRFECAVGDAPSFSGDRIYVMKDGLSLPFFGGAGRVKLKRWDVAVFKLPEEPEVRYIKRLVGMPNEVIRIDGGDLWVQPLDRSGRFERLLRPLDHQQAMQMMVYDDAHRAAALADDPALAALGRRTRPASGPSRRRGPIRARSATPAIGPSCGTITSSPAPRSGKRFAPASRCRARPVRRLITDYYSYNTDVSADDQSHPRSAARAWFQPHWVGDLTLSLRLDRARAGRPVSTGADQGRRFQSLRDRPGERRGCGSSTATIALGDGSPDRRSRGPATHDLAFANVDGRLTLWVDGASAVRRRAGPTIRACEPPAPTAADLEPVRIAAQRRFDRGRQAGPETRRLLHPRTGRVRLFQPGRVGPDRFVGPARAPLRPGAVPQAGPLPAARLSDRTGTLSDAGRQQPLEPRRTRLGRARPDRPGPPRPRAGTIPGRQSWEVPEALLIGKAFCVYWPHPKPVWPRLRLGADTRLPILPYIERMRWIR